MIPHRGASAVRLGRALPLAAGLLVLAAPAAAQVAPKLGVTTAGCPDLDAAEIQRLVELELISTPGVGKQVPPAQIELVCAAASVTIVIRNPD
jgi:hypothetical protein